MYTSSRVRENEAPTSLLGRLNLEMKKQRLKFRFYRDYFADPQIQRHLKSKPLVHYKLKLILDSIRQEIKQCLYPEVEDENGRIVHKYEHLLTIESYLDKLELIKNSNMLAYNSQELASVNSAYSYR